MANTLVKSRL